MIQIKRNSAEFKKVKDIFLHYAEKPSRKKSIKLYALRPYEELSEKILINSAAVYNITYDTVLDYMTLNRSKKLFREEKSGVYYFKSGSKSRWTEFPFKLAAKIQPPVLKVIK